MTFFLPADEYNLIKSDKYFIVKITIVDSNRLIKNWDRGIV